MNSTHKVEVVPVVLETHPNADSLSIVKVYGYSVCIKTDSWSDDMLGAYIPPDSVVDTNRPEFAFLAKPGSTKNLHRIRAVKLRGVVSFGLLVQAPAGAALGDDVSEQLGVIHYEPMLQCADMGGESESPPAHPAPTYDLDSLRRYAACFTAGEPVYVTEKIHGTSSRYVCHDGRMHVGSRREWKAEDPSSLYWTALRNTPALEEFCRANEGTVVYGEVYGWVQELRYGHGKGHYAFAAFDLLHHGVWLNHIDARALAPNLPWAPDVAGPVPFNLDLILPLAEGNTLIPGAAHMREGVVISPAVERYDQRIGRVKLKLVGAGYLSS